MEKTNPKFILCIIQYEATLDVKKLATSIRKLRPVGESRLEESQFDLTELDSIYSSLREDLKDDVANEEVIEAMVQNYRLRVEILEEMLLFLNEQNSNTQPNTTEYDM